MTITTPEKAVEGRRPIKARNSRWASAMAMGLARRGVTPNAISIAGVVFSAAAGACLLGTLRAESAVGRAILFVAAIAGIQARLICNLLDGMVAVEGGKGGKCGQVYNDLPDRLSDPLTLVAAGYAAAGAWGIGLGWLAGVLAVMTAYVRVLGRSLGTPVYFAGPMAKQHRMAVMTTACAISAVVTVWGWHRIVLLAALVMIDVGSAITVVRRTRMVMRDLEQR